MMYWTIEKEGAGKSFPHIRTAPYPGHIHLNPKFLVKKFTKQRDIVAFGTWHNRPVPFKNPDVRRELGMEDIPIGAAKA